MNKQLLTSLWTLILRIGFTLLYCSAAYNYVVHGIEPSNMTILTLLSSLIAFDRREK